MDIARSATTKQRRSTPSLRRTCAPTSRDSSHFESARRTGSHQVDRRCPNFKSQIFNRVGQRAAKAASRPVRRSKPDSIASVALKTKIKERNLRFEIRTPPADPLTCGQAKDKD